MFWLCQGRNQLCIGFSHLGHGRYEIGHAFDSLGLRLRLRRCYLDLELVNQRLRERLEIGLWPMIPDLLELCRDGFGLVIKRNHVWCRIANEHDIARLTFAFMANDDFAFLVIAVAPFVIALIGVARIQEHRDRKILADFATGVAVDFLVFPLGTRDVDIVRIQ